MKDRALKRLGNCLGLVALLIGLAWLWATPAAAHKGKVVSSTVVTAGPYTLDVLFYTSPQVGQTIPITIAPRPTTSDGQALNTRPQLAATLQPSPGMSAREIRLRVYDDPDQTVYYAVDPVVDTRGVWVLQLAVEGEAGTATGSTKLVVTGEGGPGQSNANAPAQATTPVPASQGTNIGFAIPVAVGLALLGVAGWWLLRRPAPKATPARRRK
ncbi:MAG: hypothetical protein QOH93_2137 [Chloroflexia bacterium]|jgi:hypothetical protein|nr:hypothetical protein [Chloroflexia bacterium]